MNDGTAGIASDETDLELLWVGLGHVHRFAENLSSEDGCLLKGKLFSVVILEGADSIDAVFASGMSLPGSIVSGWVRAVELVALHGIPAGVHERDAEGAATAHLGADVLLVSEEADKLLAVDGGALAVIVALAMETSLVNKNVSIGNDS